MELVSCFQETKFNFACYSLGIYMQELAVLLTGCRQLSIIPCNPRDYCKSSENFVALDSHKSSGIFTTPFNNLLQKDPHEIYISVCFPTKMVIAQRFYNIVTISLCHAPGGLSLNFHSSLPIKTITLPHHLETGRTKEDELKWWLLSLVKKCEDS